MFLLFICKYENKSVFSIFYCKDCYASVHLLKFFIFPELQLQPLQRHNSWKSTFFFENVSLPNLSYITFILFFWENTTSEWNFTWQNANRNILCFICEFISKEHTNHLEVAKITFQNLYTRIKTAEPIPFSIRTSVSIQMFLSISPFFMTKDRFKTTTYEIKFICFVSIFFQKN